MPRIAVDLNRCQGYAQCAFLAPEVFAMHGDEALLYDPAPDDGQREKLAQAAAACPVQAVLVDAVETGDTADAAAGAVSDR
ncbi:ferredoxin [Streptomyces sp. YKOK-I1]